MIDLILIDWRQLYKNNCCKPQKSTPGPHLQLLVSVSVTGTRLTLTWNVSLTFVILSKGIVIRASVKQNRRTFLTIYHDVMGLQRSIDTIRRYSFCIVVFCHVS